MKTIEEQLAEALKENKDLKTKITALEESTKVACKQAAATTLSGLLKEHKLPEVAVKRIQKQFAEAVNPEGMKEAIEAEVAYVKELGGKVAKGNGAHQQAVQENEGGDDETLNESQQIKRCMKEMRLNEKEARKFLGLD